MAVPFVVGKPVTGEYFINRKDELGKITTLISAPGSLNNIMLLAQRRTGKSSLLYNLKEQDAKTVYVMFDAYGTSTKERFARTYIHVILSTCAVKLGDASYKKKVKKAFGGGISKLQNKISNVDVTIAEFAKLHVSFRKPATDPDESLESALNFAEVVAKEKKISLVVMIDEFQELLKWKDGFLKIFRKTIQSQQNVSYVLSGSAPTVMHKLIHEAKSPLYRQLIHIQLGKLPKDEVTAFIKKRFAAVGMKISCSASEYIFELSRGYADYVQRLGMQAFLLCLDKKSVVKSDVDLAYEEMLVQLDADFGSAFSQRTELEQEILIALATGKVSTSAISREIRKPQSTIPKTMNRLMASDVVERYYKGKYRIADGVFSDWVCRQIGTRGARDFKMPIL